MQRNLFGDHIPVQYAVDATRQPELFGALGSSGSAWMRAAEQWAEVEGLAITRFEVDQVFFVGSFPFRVMWDGLTWRVEA